MDLRRTETTRRLEKDRSGERVRQSRACLKPRLFRVLFELLVPHKQADSAFFRNVGIIQTLSYAVMWYVRGHIFCHLDVD